MTWGAIAGAVISAGSAAYQGSRNRRAARDLANKQGELGSAQDAAQQQTANEKENLLWQTDQNKQNQLWANAINQQNIAGQTAANRENQLWGRDLNQQALQDQFNTNQEALLGQNQLNRENQQWMQGINQSAVDRQTGQNRLDWGKEGFGSGAFNAETGRYDISLDPSQKANMDIMRGKQEGILGGLGGGYDINSTVRDAVMNQMMPGVQQKADADRARAAAMGLGAGTGVANDRIEQQIGKNWNDMLDKATLSGFQADQALRGSNRADLGSMGQMENTMLAGMQSPQYAQSGIATVGAPTAGAAQMGAAQVAAPNQGVATVGAPSTGAPTSAWMDAWTRQQNLLQGQAAQQMNQNAGIGAMGGALGGAVSGMDFNKMFGGGGGAGGTQDAGGYGLIGSANQGSIMGTGGSDWTSNSFSGGVSK